jgi:hypothetical protein
MRGADTVAILITAEACCVVALPAQWRARRVAAAE